MHPWYLSFTVSTSFLYCDYAIHLHFSTTLRHTEQSNHQTRIKAFINPSTRLAPNQYMSIHTHAGNSSFALITAINSLPLLLCVCVWTCVNCCVYLFVIVDKPLHYLKFNLFTWIFTDDTVQTLKIININRILTLFIMQLGKWYLLLTKFANGDLSGH